MTKINSFCLYYTSFLPLWIAILFIDIKNIIVEKENLYTEKISVFMIIIIFIFSLIIENNLITNKRKNGLEKYEIQSVKKSKDVTIEYFLAYILPLFAFDFTMWDQVILFLIFYISLGLLCIKNNYFTANIILEMLKYNFYECTLKNMDDVLIQRVVISKKNLNSGTTIKLRSINNEYMMD